MGDDEEKMSIRECLVFAQVVHEVGAANWMTISNVLGKHPLVTRTRNFYSPSSCQAIYAGMMKELDPAYADGLPEGVDLPKAKPNLRLAQKFYKQRVQELVDLIARHETDFKTITQEMDEIQSGKWDARIEKEFASPPPPNESGSQKTQPMVLAPDEGSGDDDAADAEKEPTPMDEDMEMGFVVDESFDEPVAPIASAETPLKATPIPAPTNEDEDMMTEDEVPVVAQRTPPPPPETSTVKEDAPTAEKEEDAPRSSTSELERNNSIAGSEANAKTMEEEEAGGAEGGVDNGIVLETPEVEVETDVSSVNVPKSHHQEEERESPEAKAKSREPSPAQEESEEIKGAEVSENEVDDDDEPEPTRGSRSNKKAASVNKRKQADAQPTDRKRRRTSPSSDREEEEIAHTTTRGSRRARPSISTAAATPQASAPTPSISSSGPFAPPTTTTRGARQSTSSTSSSKPAGGTFSKTLDVFHGSLSNLKGYSLFANPVTNDLADGYDEVVYEPQDLKTIKTNVKNGSIATTDEYERAIYVMFANAIMYNLPGTPTAKDATEMMELVEQKLLGHRETERLVKQNSKASK